MSNVEKLYELKNSTVFSDGSYKQQCDNVGVNGNVFEYHDIVSAQFNQLKAKIFNVIEGSALTEKQGDAIKGLIKGFCNEHFKNTVGDLEGLVERLGFKSDYSNIRTNEI